MLFVLSLGNYALMYQANIYLARHLEIGAFDDYSVAISVVTLLSTLATLGLEKYALRIIALYIERESWQRLRGFLRFSFQTILAFSLILMAVMSVGLEGLLAWQDADFHIAIVIYTGFLPIIALCLFLVEVITVYGQQILGLALYRFFLPGLFLLLMIYSNQVLAEITAVSAVLCFGAAWCCTLALMIFTAKAASPRASRKAQFDSKGRIWWLRKSLPLLISSLMMTVLTSAGTIILEILYPSKTVVGIFSVVMQTTALISLIGTSTNRYYLPMLVVLLERHDKLAVRKILNKRARLITSFIVIFLSIIFSWGHQILELFGTDFAQGYYALCISASGAAFSTLFSVSPYYLQFMGRNRLVVGLMSITAISMIGLSFFLGHQYGASGVAVAYALPTILLFSCLKWIASRHMRHYLHVNVQSEQHP